MKVVGDNWLMVLFLFLAFVVLTAGSWVTSNVETLPPRLQPYINGFGGNITAGVVGSLLFLVLTTHLDKRTTIQINRIHDAASKSEELLSRRERIVRNQEQIQHFLEFLSRHSYYDACFPKLGMPDEPNGLQYTIEPVRDSAGRPLTRETELDTQHIVRVRGPAYWQSMDHEQRKAYAASPIRDGEYYFCQFFNDSWHMSADSIMGDAYRFYLSGKVGQAEWGTSANAFVASRIGVQPKGLTQLGHLYLTPVDGTPLSDRGGGGVDKYELYRDEEANLYLSVNESPPKKIYMTNPPDTYDDASWHLVIEDMGGRASGEKLKNIANAIEKKLLDLGVNVPRVPWIQLNNPANERA